MTQKQVSSVRDVVSMAYRYAIREKIVRHNPARDVLYHDLPVQKTAAYNTVKVKPFTPEEAARITDWCLGQVPKTKAPAYLWAIVINLVLGLRVGELSALRWSDIDLDQQKVIVRRQLVKDYDEDILCTGYIEVGNLKGYEKPRVLTIRPDIVAAFKELRTDDDRVFPVFRYRTYNDKIKQAAVAIGLAGEEYRTHSLRATAATALYLQTKDIYAVQSLLGHTTVEMTLKYIKDIQAEERLRAAMLAVSASDLSCLFVPKKKHDSGQEKTSQTLDFTGFVRSQVGVEHRGFEAFCSLKKH